MALAVAGVASLGAASLVGGAGFATFASILSNIGVSMLLQGAASLFAEQPEDMLGPNRMITSRGSVQPREIVYGKVRKGGTLVYFTTTGAKIRTAADQPDDETGEKSASNAFFPNGGSVADLPRAEEAVGANEYLHMVVAMAAHRVEKFGAIYLDGQLAVSASGAVSDRYKDKLWVQKRLGATSQSAVNTLWEYTKDWTENHRLNGIAYLYLRMKWDADAYPTGIPNVTADVWGKSDILNPATGERGWTANPALCIADYLTLERFGIGADREEIPDAALIQAARVCAEPVPVNAREDEARYSLNGVIALNQTPQTIVQAMLTSCAGYLVRRSGEWIILPGAYRAPNLTLTEDHAAGPIRVTTRLSQSSNFNGVRGTFISPENDWQADDFPAYASDYYLSEDRGRRVWKDIELPFTTSASMAQRLAKIELETARRQISVEMAVGMIGFAIAAGDTVALTFPRYGWNAKPFMVTNWRPEVSEAGAVAPVLQLSEISPAAWNWAASEERIYAVAPRTRLPSPWDVMPPGPPQVTESLYVTRTGDGVKTSVFIKWGTPPSAGVARYILDGSHEGGPWRRYAEPSTNDAIVEDVAPGSWRWRVRTVNVLGVRSDWAVSSCEVYGLAREPSALSGVTIQVAGGVAMLRWNLPADLDVRLGGQIVIRHSDAAPGTWATGRTIETVAGAQTIASVPLLPGAYVLRARDSSGQYGPEAVVYSSGAQVAPFAPLGALIEQPVFAGTHSGTAAGNGVLTLGGARLLDDAPDFDQIGDFDAYGGYNNAGTYTFATGFDFGSVKNVRLRSRVEMSVGDTTARFDDRTGNVDDWADWDGASLGECTAWVEIRTTLTAPTGSPVWSDWSRLDAGEIRARGVQARARLLTDDPAFLPTLSALELQASEAL